MTALSSFRSTSMEADNAQTFHHPPTPSLPSASVTLRLGVGAVHSPHCSLLLPRWLNSSAPPSDQSSVVIKGHPFRERWRKTELSGYNCLNISKTTHPLLYIFVRGGSTVFVGQCLCMLGSCCLYSLIPSGKCCVDGNNWVHRNRERKMERQRK